VVDSPAQQVRDEDLLDAVRAELGGGAPVATTGDVEERVDLGQTAIRMRLNELAEDGEVRKQKVGTVSVFYFEDEAENLLPDDLEEHVAEYAERQDMTKYEAVRDLTKTGLRFSLTEEKLDGGVTDTKSFSAVFALGMLAVTSWAAAGLAAALSFGGAARTLGVLGFVCVVVAAVVGVAGSRIENMLS